MITFNGKAIYNPSGKAGEYSYWACNFYVGCSNGCEYCYCKKGIISKQLGGDKPTLKKCFKDEIDAREIFTREVNKNIDNLKEYGLFFSFTTDPCLKETFELTAFAVNYCMMLDIPVKILTKQFISDFTLFNWVHLDNQENYKKLIAIGHTLTGHDELEKNADTNKRRIESMKTLHNSGFKTFASIEPIIDFNSSLQMIIQSLEYCDLYKIGLESGKKYNKKELLEFIKNVNSFERKVYWKDGLLKSANIEISDLPINCVNRDYNIFK